MELQYQTLSSPDLVFRLVFPRAPSPARDRHFLLVILDPLP